MKKIKQAIKNYLYSPSCPEALSQAYFRKKDSADRERFFELVRGGSDLIDGVKQEAHEHWNERIQNVLDAKDNEDIPRHELAGQLIGETLVMHNGLKIDPMSYYGLALMKMLMLNKGVHEPQEEKIFQEVLKSLNPEKSLTMLELGAYWSFYSMWLLSLFPEAKCIMVEPDKKNLYYGQRNFALNSFTGQFVQAGIGKAPIREKHITTVDEQCKQHDIDFLDILHADIQGYEEEMLEGSERMLYENRIGYAFISTHSNELHEACRKRLLTFDFEEVASANVDESYSWDGILVMKARHYSGLQKVQIAKRKES